jgi:hypothetical protein
MYIHLFLQLSVFIIYCIVDGTGLEWCLMAELGISDNEPFVCTGR